jgi:thioesterase domain-containing protein
MSAQSTEDSSPSSDEPHPDRDIIKKQIASAWIAEITMKTESVICPLTVDLTKAISREVVPFYCVHSISGAGGAELRHLATFLTSEQPLIAIQSPMSQRRKESVKSIDILTKYYCKTVLAFHQAHYGRRPFILGGWSAGATIALEMAQRLARVRQMPALLIAIDKAPRNTKAEIDPIRNSLLNNLYLWLRLEWRKGSTISDFRNRVCQKASWCLQNRQVYGSDFSETDKRNHLNQLTTKSRTRDEREFIESLWEELEDYRPSLYDGKVLVLMTREGWIDRVAEGWKAIAKHLKIIEVPGTHTSIIRGTVINGVANLDDVRSLAEVLRRELPEQLQQSRRAASVTDGPTAPWQIWRRLVLRRRGGPLLQVRPSVEILFGYGLKHRTPTATEGDTQDRRAAAWHAE